MLSIFNDRREYVTLKRHLESTFEEQYWAKDSLARAFSAKFKGVNSNLILIGPKGKQQQKRSNSHKNSITKIMSIVLLIFRAKIAVKSQ